MTYEEAKDLERQILKDSIRSRLYKYDPVKYAKFKPYVNKPFNSDSLMTIWDMVTTIRNKEHGNPFERDFKFFGQIIKRR